MGRGASAAAARTAWFACWRVAIEASGAYDVRKDLARATRSLGALDRTLVTSQTRHVQATRRGGMRKIFIGLGAALAVGLGTAVALGAIPDSDGNFYACVKKSNGTIRMIDKSQTCTIKEQRVSWPAQQAELKIYRVSGFTGTLEQGSPLVTSIASCDDGDPVTGGGFTISGGPFNIDDLAILASEPGHFQNHDEWQVKAMMDNATLRLHAVARCLDLPPAHT